MHAFTDPYLNVKLLTCLCQQLNYTIKNGACLRKYPVLLLRTDRKCKSAYGYQVTVKREGWCYANIYSIFFQVLQYQAYCGLWRWSHLRARSSGELAVVYNTSRNRVHNDITGGEERKNAQQYTLLFTPLERGCVWWHLNRHTQITNWTWGLSNLGSFQESGWYNNNMRIQFYQGKIQLLPSSRRMCLSMLTG